MRPGGPDITFDDITRVTRDLDRSPQVPIEKGVAQLLGHIDYWREAPVWEPDAIADAMRGWFKYLGKRWRLAAKAGRMLGSPGSL